MLAYLRINASGVPIWGGVFLQAYEPTTGTAVGWYEDGRVAIVDNTYGKGRTRLIGSMAGFGHAAHTPDGSDRFFADLLALGGKQQHVRCSDPRVKARLHAGPGGTFLWIANPTRQPHPVRLELGETWGPFSSVRTLSGAEAQLSDRTINLTAPARDVTVLALD